MRKHIFRSVLGIILFSLLIYEIAQACISYRNYRISAQQQLRSIANILTENCTDCNKINSELQKNLSYYVRLTYVDFDGNVIYDSDTDARTLGNHYQRKEISDALKYGNGEATRDSQTFGKYTYYYAVKNNCGIYRFSCEINNFIYEFSKTFVRFILCGIAIVAIAAIFSARLSKKLVQPIAEMTRSLDENNNSLDSNMITSKYKELIPIADTISVLNKKLDKYRGRLKNESEKIAMIFENMVEGLVILDDNGRIMNINKSAADMFSRETASCESVHISELIDDQNLLDALTLNDGSRNIRKTVEIQNKKICIYINRVNIASMNCIIMILANISGEINAEDLRREFSANVSHELKTPLTTIKGFGELFGSGMITEPEDIRKYGARIERESQRLLFLINDIIRLSELEETTEITLSCVNLMRAAKESAELLTEKAQKHSVNIFFDGDDKLQCMCNESYIRELFTNLIDNSIKYNKPGGYVKINVTSKNNENIISVKDSGIGIPEKDKDRIFERFYRVDKSHSRQTGGTGLGLSIVKHIVSYHKGRVTLDSTLGEGTEIKIYLPNANAKQ